MSECVSVEDHSLGGTLNPRIWDVLTRLCSAYGGTFLYSTSFYVEDSYSHSPSLHPSPHLHRLSISLSLRDIACLYRNVASHWSPISQPVIHWTTCWRCCWRVRVARIKNGSIISPTQQRQNGIHLNRGCRVVVVVLIANCCT